MWNRLYATDNLLFFTASTPELGTELYVYSPGLMPSSFSPTKGSPNDEVLIKGNNFSFVVDQNLVKFNGVVAQEIIKN